VTSSDVIAREPVDPVGVIGLGAMGGTIAAHLVDAGYDVIGYDPDSARTEALAARGGGVAGSAAEVAARGAVVLTSLPTVAAVHEVVGSPDGVVASAGAGTIVVETSTTPLDVRLQARDLLLAGGITLIDCPLSGTADQARVKDIVVLASGDRAAVDRCAPIFDAFARQRFYLGDFGAGTRMKLLANLLVAVHTVAAAEAFVLARAAGLDLEQFREVISAGAGASRMFDVRVPRMIEGDFHPGMRVRAFRKDLAAITDFAAGLDVPLPLGEVAQRLVVEADQSGHADDELAVLSEVLERARPGRGPQ
jgi:L-threonate 2-dehydrogenase